MISFSHFPLLLCTLLLWFPFAQPVKLSDAINAQRMSNANMRLITLSASITYTVGPTALVVDRDLELITLSNGKARLECAQTCFHLHNGSSLWLNLVDVVFGINAINDNAALVSVPTPPQQQSGFGDANVTITGSTVQSYEFTSGETLPGTFPLVLFAHGAIMRHVKIHTSLVNVDTLTLQDFSVGQPSMNGAPPFTTFKFDMTSSSLFCADRNYDCVLFDGRKGMDSITVVNSKLEYESNQWFGGVLLRVEPTTAPARQPNVTIQSFSVPSGEQLVLSFANSVYLENITLNADASLAVTTADTVFAKSLTQLASTDGLTEPMRFDEVRNVTMEDVTIIGVAPTAPAGQCAELPIITIDTLAYSPVPNYATITRLKANGTFCDGGILDYYAPGILNVNDIANVQVIDSEFNRITTKRALLVQNASIVNVLDSRFTNVRADTPGLVRVFGAVELRTQLRVQNTTFESISMQRDSALIATNVVAILKSVNFTLCADVMGSSFAALTLDAVGWGFNRCVVGGCRFLAKRW
jgi:hypothetical protein